MTLLSIVTCQSQCRDLSYLDLDREIERRAERERDLERRSSLRELILVLRRPLPSERSREESRRFLSLLRLVLLCLLADSFLRCRRFLSRWRSSSELEDSEGVSSPLLSLSLLLTLRRLFSLLLEEDDSGL